MYIAMNRFKVLKGAESAFESVWLSRDSHLERVPGFIEFHLLRGPERDDHVLYSSHTVWASRTPSRPGPNPSISAPRIAMPAPTSRSMPAIRSSRGSRSSRRS